MPCYSVVTTKLLDAEAVKTAIEQLGWKVKRFEESRIIFEARGGRTVQLFRVRKSETFQTYSVAPQLDELTRKYAEVKVKAFAKKKGYLVSRGTTEGEFVLTSYK